MLETLTLTLTCGGDAVETHKGVEAGGSAREDAGEAVGHEPAHPQVDTHQGRISPTGVKDREGGIHSLINHHRALSRAEDLR